MSAASDTQAIAENIGVTPPASAHRVWNHGIPQAATVEDARRDWAPYLNTWGWYLESNFYHSMSVSNQVARLGWIDDATFWQHVWSGVEKEVLVKNGSYFSCVCKLRCALEEAAMLNNKVPFESMLNEETRRTTVGMFANKSFLMPNAVFQLLKFFHADTHFLENVQHDCWLALPWKRESQSLLYHSRWELRGMHEIVDLLAYGLTAYACDKTSQLNVLGHAIANAPPAWQSKALNSVTFVEALRARLTPLLADGVDLDTLALCSGVALNTNNVSKGIKSLGRHFCAGNVDVKKKNPTAPELSVVLGLYELKSSHDLYEVACLLMQQSAVESVSLAGMFDDGLTKP